jgi:hypothetical protein
MDPPYARVRDPLLAELVVLDIDELRRVVRQLERTSHRLTWRRKVSARASLLAAVLRGLPRIIGDAYVGRVKREDRWDVLVRDEPGVVVAVEIRTTKPRSWDSAGHPLTVHVTRPDLVDVEEIERWQQRINERRRRRLQSGARSKQATTSSA